MHRKPGKFKRVKVTHKRDGEAISAQNKTLTKNNQQNAYDLLIWSRHAVSRRLPVALIAIFSSALARSQCGHIWLLLSFRVYGSERNPVCWDEFKSIKEKEMHNYNWLSRSPKIWSLSYLIQNIEPVAGNRSFIGAFFFVLLYRRILQFHLCEILLKILMMYCMFEISGPSLKVNIKSDHNEPEFVYRSKSRKRN